MAETTETSAAIPGDLETLTEQAQPAALKQIGDAELARLMKDLRDMKGLEVEPRLRKALTESLRNAAAEKLLRMAQKPPKGAAKAPAKAAAAKPGKKAGAGKGRAADERGSKAEKLEEKSRKLAEKAERLEAKGRKLAEKAEKARVKEAEKAERKAALGAK